MAAQQWPWYHRKQRNLEADLQLLLDAQAEGLTSASEPTFDSSRSTTSTDSSTPTLQSNQDIPRGDRGRISLHDARKGLYMTMRRLALLKSEEAKDVDAGAESVTASFQQTQVWSDRRSRLISRTEEIRTGKEAQVAAEIREQATSLQPRIDELEQELLTLRNEQRKLRKEAEDVENRVQAKMSSYTRALEALDRDVQEFLQSMLPADPTTTMFSNDDEHEEEPFWTLSTKRRTLGMARDVLEKEKQAAETKLALVETEREALEEGAAIWQEVLRLVEGFEKSLREEMRTFSPSDAAQQTRGAGSPERRLHDVLHRMDEVSSELERKLKFAEGRGWKLLMAAIGAELHAFQKGRGVLEETLGISQRGGGSPSFDGEDQGVNSVIHSPQTRAMNADGDDGRQIRDLDREFEGRHPLDGGSSDGDDEEDDGPDPELLISHHDNY